MRLPAGSPAASPALLLALVALTLPIACGGDAPTAPMAPLDICEGFSDWSASPYVLPYPVGSGYLLGQSNCSGFGHSGYWKYGYDFHMPIGSLLTASRAGVVLHSVEDAVDGDRTRTNLVTVQHVDGTVAVYSHLTFEGALVDVGDAVAQGQPIGLSGHTGFSHEPHLHFSVHTCGRLPGLPGGDPDPCPTLPITFRNTDPNSQGLAAGRIYVAQPY